MINVFIDDSGSANIDNASAFDSPMRKSWVALILNETQAEDVDQGVKKLIEQLENETGISEFHFTDIASGAKRFKSVDLNRRQDILEHFAMIYSEMEYPLLIQSLNPEDYDRSKIIVEEVRHHVEGFNLADHSDFALVLLLLRLRDWLTDPRFNPDRIPIKIVIDAGKQKPGTICKCTLFGDLLKDQRLFFESSALVPSLQFVDFAAFMLNRHRMTLMKKEKTAYDKYLWSVFAKARFNVINMEKRLLSGSEDTVTLYDEILNDAYQKNDVLQHITLQQLAQLFYKKK